MPGAAERAFGTQVDQIHAANNIDVLLPISHQPARRLLSGLQAFFNGETPSSDQLPRRACAVPLRRMDSPVVLTVNDLDETRGATSPAEWSASRRNSALSIICFGDTETQTRLEKSGIPVLSLFPDGDLAGGAIIFDVPRIGVLAGEYFTQNGYVFFAFVGDLTRREVCKQLGGYQSAVEKISGAGADSNAGGNTAVKVFDSARLGTRGTSDIELRDWLISLPKPIAIHCATDMLAYRLALAAARTGFRIPNDVAIVGTGNDLSVCQWCQPALSSIDLDFRDVGRRLGEMIFEGVGPTEVNKWISQIVPPGPLLPRASSNFLIGAPGHVPVALEYIRENAGRGVSVKMTAAHLGISRRKLERDFHRYVGHSPYEEIRRVRVEKIKELLKSGMSLSQIAIQTGFSSAQYMGKFFAAATGAKPRDFRDSVA